MAITLKLNVSFPMSIVVPKETLEEFSKAREMSRVIISSGKELKGEEKYRIELMASDKSDEQCFEQIYRQGNRLFIKKDFREEIQGVESRVSVGDVKVAFEANPASIKLATADAALANWLQGGTQLWIMMSSLESLKRCLEIRKEYALYELTRKCELHDDSRACTALCKRFTVTQ